MIHKNTPFIEETKPLFLRKNQLTFHVTEKAREFIISLAQNRCIFCHILLHKICYRLKKWAPKNLKKLI